MKRCVDCNVEIDEKCWRCPACACAADKKTNARYYKKNQACVRERTRLWRLANPEKLKAQRDRAAARKKKT